MNIKIAIVDDNPSFSKVLELLLKDVKINKVKIETETFEDPEKYLENETKFNIAIIDCIFKGYPSSMNGMFLASETKGKNPKCKTILASEFANSEFSPIISAQNNNVDYYSSKNLSNSAFLKKIKEYIKELKELSQKEEENIELKLHIYKQHKELFFLKDINYAMTKDRAKHLITINTKDKDITLSSTITQFVKKINHKLRVRGINIEHQKVKQDLFINVMNIKDLNTSYIKFKNGSRLDIDSSIYKKLSS